MAEVGDRVIKDKVCRGKGLHVKKYIPDNHHYAKDHTAAPVCDKDRFTRYRAKTEPNKATARNVEKTTYVVFK